MLLSNSERIQLGTSTTADIAERTQLPVITADSLYFYPHDIFADIATWMCQTRDGTK